MRKTVPRVSVGAASLSRLYTSVMLEHSAALTPWRLTLVLCALVLVRGVALMCVLPPGEGWDEYQHVAYVHELANGRGLPELGKTTVDREVARAAAGLPMSKAAADQLKQYGGTSYEEYWKSGETRPASTAPEGVPLYQAQHAPAWYGMVAPLYRWAGAAENWRGSVAALRLVNLLLLVLAVPAIVWTMHIVWRGGTIVGMVCVAAALSPMMLLNGVRAANDSLAVLAISLAVLCLALSMRGRVMWVTVAALLTAGAFWCKTTSIALVPFGVTAILVCMGGRRWPARLAMAGLFAVVTLVLISPYLVQSYSTHGVLIPAQESVRLRQAGEGWGEQLRAALSVDWWDCIEKWWGRGTLWIGGWSFIRAAKLWRTLYELLLTVGVICWMVSLAVPRIRGAAEAVVPWRSGAFCLLLCGGFTLALGAHAVSSQLAWGSVMTNSWYASAAIPMLLMLAISGYARVLRGRGALLMAAAVATLFVLVELIGLLWLMPARYVMLPLWSGGMQRLESIQPAVLGRYTLMAALVAELVLLCGIVYAVRRELGRSGRAEQDARVGTIPENA